MNVIKRDGRKEPLDINKIHRALEHACSGSKNVSISQIEIKAHIQFFDGIHTSDIDELLIKSAASLISEETPDYQIVASALINNTIRKYVYNIEDPKDIPHLLSIVRKNTDLGLYDSRILGTYSEEEFEYFNKKINHNKDYDLTYASMVQFKERYLVRNRVTEEFFETPQVAYMLIAMCSFMHYPKESRKKYVVNAYKAFSDGAISVPTPILSGCRTPQYQYSSCTLIEVDDSLDSINAAASAVVKYASQKAGIGLNISNIRALKSPIRNGDAYHTGVIPFIKYLEAALKSCSQGGVRGSAGTVYYQMWHYEFPELVVLKNNKGTDESRARKLDYGVQINGYLYKRLLANGNITLFSPHDVPGLLHAFYTNQEEFARLYEKYEKDPKIRKRVYPAAELFTMLMLERSETGRIYIQNVDNTNKHSPFDEDRVALKMSNLCFTGDTVVAVADGRNGVTIKQLAEESNGLIKFPVYSSSERSKLARMKIPKRNGGYTQITRWNSPEIQDAVAFKSGTKSVVRVLLDNGGSFRCTPDHELALVSGGYTEAKDSVGKYLQPFFTHTPEIGSAYRHINSVSNGNQKQHILIWKHFVGEIPEGYVIDHIEPVRTGLDNDHIDNLQAISIEEHKQKTLQHFCGYDNPVHRVVVDERVESNRGNLSTGTNNNNSSGISDFELVMLGRVIHRMFGGEFDYNKYFMLRDYCNINVPIRFSKNRFSGSFEVYKQYVLGELKLEKYDSSEGLIFEEREISERIKFIEQHFTKRDELGNILIEGVKVVDVIYTGEVEDVYDLTVDNNHNFYIITSTQDERYSNCEGILVHNCAEITLPTKPLENILDPEGEIALCILSAINWGVVTLDTMEYYCDIAVRFLDAIIDIQSYPVKAAETSTMKYRSLGIGITNLAYALAKIGAKYGDKESLEYASAMMEAQQYFCMKASVQLAKEYGSPNGVVDIKRFTKGISPIDTQSEFAKESAKGLGADISPKQDWASLMEELTTYGIRNATLTAIMPVETSSVIIGATNGIEPPRALISTKANKDWVVRLPVPGIKQYGKKYQLLWDDVSTEGYLLLVAIIQMWVDQSISTNTSYNPENFPGGEVPLQVLLKDLVTWYRLGGKTLYYNNTYDGAGLDSEEDSGCAGGACKL